MNTDTKRYTPENINELKPNEIFCFGSNEAGIHGAGAAALAHKKFGAKWGKGEGLHRQTYAIPTKDENIETLPLSEIEDSIFIFCCHAAEHPELTFLMTKIGCGLAGYEIKDIAALFHKFTFPPNVILPKEFHKH